MRICCRALRSTPTPWRGPSSSFSRVSSKSRSDLVDRWAPFHVVPMPRGPADSDTSIDELGEQRPVDHRSAPFPIEVGCWPSRLDLSQGLALGLERRDPFANLHQHVS